MKQISKNFASLKKAQNFMESLYLRYDYVRMSVFPRFSESGEYVFTVDWSFRFCLINFGRKYENYSLKLYNYERM